MEAEKGTWERGKKHVGRACKTQSKVREKEKSAAGDKSGECEMQQQRDKREWNLRACVHSQARSLARSVHPPLPLSLSRCLPCTWLNTPLGRGRQALRSDLGTHYLLSLCYVDTERLK